MDEIHLLGEDRGPVLEVIVSRMRYIAASAATQNSRGQRQVRCFPMFEVERYAWQYRPSYFHTLEN